MAMLMDASYEVARFCLDRGLVDLVRFKTAETQSKASGTSVYKLLVNSNAIEDAAAKSAVAAYLDLPEIEASAVREQFTQHLSSVPANFALENRVIPLGEQAGRFRVAISEPSALRSLSSVRLITGKDVGAVLVSPIEMEGLLEDLANSVPKQKADSAIRMSPPKDHNKTDVAKLSSLLAKSGQVPARNTASPAKGSSEQGEATDDGQGRQVISFVNELLFSAIRQGASDIHLDAYKDKAVARYRIDGVLEPCRDIGSFLFANYAAVTTRLKIMSDLDISERRLPQDGAITISLPEGRDVDLRVSVLPTVFGERVVMRILDRDGISFDLDKLGFPEKEYADVVAAFEASQGMVLVTGPTGSGKSTTLYGALRRLNKPGVNILTAEDPVEFTIEGVGQVQIRDDIGLTFAAALRSFLRQDPEVILVGEIRDKETADISIKAALTGHLVLSTLHANDAVSTIIRLINMGIPGYLIAAALTLVIAQRLARRICTHCREPVPGDQAPILKTLGFTDEEAQSVVPYHGAGCDRCNHSGYKGRQAIYEVLRINEEMRAAINAEDRRTLKSIALADGFRPMQVIGREMIMQGSLTIEEYQNHLVFG